MLFTSDLRSAFDQHAINHLTVAVCREMMPEGRARHPLSDTLFMGGPTLRINIGDLSQKGRKLCG